MLRFLLYRMISRLWASLVYRWIGEVAKGSLKQAAFSGAIGDCTEQWSGGLRHCRGAVWSQRGRTRLLAVENLAKTADGDGEVWDEGLRTRCSFWLGPARSVHRVVLSGFAGAIRDENRVSLDAKMCILILSACQNGNPGER